MSAPQKRAGENAEAAVLQALPSLSYVSDADEEHHDAELTATLEAVDVIVPDGTPPVGAAVEIKSACVVYADESAGRWYLRKQQHEYLLDAGGWYLLAVCEPDPERAVITMQLSPATVVDDHITSWYDGGDGRADYYQLRWTTVIDDSKVFESEAIAR